MAAKDTKKKLEYKILDKNPYLESHNRVEAIGNGGFGNVSLYANDYGLLAIKNFRPGPDAQQEFEEEYECYHNIGKHVNIAEFIDGFSVKGEYFIVMEYFECGDLSKIYDDFPSYTEEDVRDIVVQVSTGLNYMNGKNYVHRDIKPQNIFVRSWEPIGVAVGDFNFSKRADGDKKTVFLTNLGTKQYKAPEMQVKEAYNQKCDVWSIGIMLYELLTGRLSPFKLESLIKSKQRMSSSKFGQLMDEKLVEFRDKKVIEFPKCKNEREVSTEGKDMVSRMLTSNPRNRISFAEILKTSWAEMKFKDPSELYDPDDFEERQRLLKKDLSRILKSED